MATRTKTGIPDEPARQEGDREWTFAALLGQEKAKKLLRRAVRSGKTPHALFFRGPAGVGKRKAAMALAAYLFCLAPTGEDSCGVCLACRKLQSGNHPDYRLILPEGTAIKIDQIRSLKTTMPYRPYEAKFRVIVLAEAHTMRREAANSLLKTLEEPPADTIIILTADERGDMLPTILSRCQIIPFQSLTLAETARYFEERQAVAPADARVLAALGDGSIGRAMRLREKKILSLRQTLLDTLMTGNPDTAETVEAVFDLAEEAAKLKENLSDLFDLLQIWLRDLILLACNEAQRVANIDMLTAMQAVAAKWPLTLLTTKAAMIDQARRQYQRNCNRNLVCEVLFLGLMADSLQPGMVDR